jgi:hypothetical protein
MIRQIDIVIIPKRGRRRTYAMNSLTLDGATWDYMQAMIKAFEKTALRYSVPLPRPRKSVKPLTLDVEAFLQP